MFSQTFLWSYIDKHVLFSLFTCRWDNDVTLKNCARDDDCNKVYDCNC